MAPSAENALPANVPDRGAPKTHNSENEWYQKDFNGFRVTEQPIFTKRKLRLVCVGAGAAGLQIAYKAERILEKYDLQIYEKNHDVGGTWLENRYPGCTCDIPSHSYQFTWHRNPNWSSYYSSSEEIWQYMKDISVKFDLEKYIKFNTRVESATWNEETGQWDLKISGPDGTFEDSCDVLFNGSGNLNSWKWPSIPGLETFKGKLMHSAAWDGDYDLTGKDVIVVGGGSSAVQIIPSIQPRVGRLTAFLRSPGWISSGFGAKYAGQGGTNFDFSPEQKEEFANNPEVYDKYCNDIEGELNKRFTLMHIDAEDQKNARDLVTKTMARRLGDDPKMAAKMTPPWALGCRRLTPGTGYLESLGADNVTTVFESVVELTETGVIDGQGKEHRADVVICATGFNTAFTPHFKVTGRNGSEIHKQFGDFPEAYLGITAANFPNLFLLPGPNGPVSHGSVLPILEWYTRYAFLMIQKMQVENIKSFEPKQEAISDLHDFTHELMKRLVWSVPCRSWFKNGKTHGPVTAIYPGSRLHFFEMLDVPRWEDYQITYQTRNRFQFMGNGYTHRELDPEGDDVWYFKDWFTTT